MENITDLDCNHSKKNCKSFEIKNLGEYHDLNLKDATLLLADVFENFRKMWFEVYKLDPARFLSAPRLAKKAALNKTKLKLKLLINIGM